MERSPNRPIILKKPSLPEAAHYVVAFSGGSDSAALLHRLAHYPPLNNKLSAIHVNHQIHPDSDQWAKNCTRQCQQYGIPCVVKVVNPKKSDENSLREERYKAIAQHIDSLPGKTCLLTAHHLNDDIETLLFRLLRGTGLNGLAGMTAYGDYMGINIYRPLIDTPKSLINQYLAEHNILWLDDSSNRDTSYDRNYIRHKIIPAFSHLRPDALQRICDTRDHLKNSLALLEQLIGNHNPFTVNPDFSKQTLTTMVYHWLTIRKLTPVNHKRLLSFTSACLSAESDKQPSLKAKQYVLVFWQQAIYALRPNLLTIDSRQTHRLTVHSKIFHWHHEFGRLSLQSKAAKLKLTVKFNVRGEKIKRPGHKHHQRVKELLRETGVPPWQRQRLPFVYVNDQLMAVGQLQSDHWQQWLTAHEAEYDWQSTNFLL